MPGREEILSTGHLYHIFNKLMDSKTIFKEPFYCKLLLDLFLYYRSTQISCSYSRFRKLPTQIQAKILRKLAFKKHFKVDILAFSFMPTHFHLLVRQRIDGGISKYISDTFNAFTRYYNIKNTRKGPLFLPRFKCVRIKSEPQLIHVSRYIHLNPYSSELVKSIAELVRYPWSSYKEYIVRQKYRTCETDTIMSLFYDHKKLYKKFVENHAEYQKTLEYAKHARKW